MYELTIPEKHEIQIIGKNFEIVGYQDLLKELDKLGEYLLSVEITEENIQENKKLVAKVRNLAKQITSERVAFKKEYMKPLDTLTAQTKEIDRRLHNYEDSVRRQIRKLEEEERQKKKQEIEEIFNKRLRSYGGKSAEYLYPFDDFFDPKFLNKSESMNKIEEKMADFFEYRQEDLSAIISFADEMDLNRDTVVNEYLKLGNVSQTINYFKEEKERKQRVSEALEHRKIKPTQTESEPCYYIKIKESDYAKAVQLLGIGGVEYELVDLA